MPLNILYLFLENTVGYIYTAFYKYYCLSLDSRAKVKYILKIDGLNGQVAVGCLEALLECLRVVWTTLY